MKTWLRVVLIVFTVGGGFTGCAMTLPYLHQAAAGSQAVLLLCALAIFVFITTSGVLFALNPRNTGLLVAAIAIQIPDVSSPMFVYRLCTGIAIIPGFFFGGSSGPNYWWQFGSYFNLALANGAPYWIGVNLAAVALLVLLLRAVSAAKNGVSAPTLHTGDRPQQLSNSENTVSTSLPRG